MEFMYAREKEIMDRVGEPRTREQDLPEESQQFAKALYYRIYEKFRVHQQPFRRRSCYPVDCSRDIHKAVFCEQLLIRDFLTNQYFPSMRLVVVNTGSVLAMCNIMCLATIGKWDYFKRLLRCSALIAEFFLYRYQRMPFPQLYKVHVVWCEVFNRLFRDEFWEVGGWFELSKYANKYIPDLYVPLNKALSRMKEPYADLPFAMTIPDLSFPVTDADRLSFEMRLALECVDVWRCCLPEIRIHPSKVPKELYATDPIEYETPPTPDVLLDALSPDSPGDMDSAGSVEVISSGELIGSGELMKFQVSCIDSAILNEDQTNESVAGPSTLGEIQAQQPIDSVVDIANAAGLVVDMKTTTDQVVNIETRANPPMSIETASDPVADMGNAEDPVVDMGNPGDPVVDMENLAVDKESSSDPVVNRENSVASSGDRENPAGLVMDMENQADLDVDMENQADPVENAKDPDENVADPVGNVTDPVENVADPVGNVADPVENAADRIENILNRIENVLNRFENVADRFENVADPVENVADPVEPPKQQPLGTNRC